MTLTRTKMRTAVIAAAAAVLLTLALMPAAPASASHPGAGATAGLATLSGGIGTCGTFTFSGVGAAATAGGAVAAPNASASGNYCNPDVVTGTASGTLTFSGTSTISCNINWQRIGVIALVTFSGGSCGFGLPAEAIAAFAPNPVANADGSITAAVVGGGIF